MREFCVVLMVGGNIPGVTRTVSIDIYDRVQAFDYSAANTTAIVLLAISFTVLSVIYALNRSRWPFGWFLRDRKSTRLNSSHVKISYAVFCLKKKKKKKR